MAEATSAEDVPVTAAAAAAAAGKEGLGVAESAVRPSPPPLLVMFVLFMLLLIESRKNVSVGPADYRIRRETAKKKGNGGRDKRGPHTQRRGCKLVRQALPGR